ncbi:uncharacterized protein [Anoplolepis gracilipes]|uniref:uncharacterized protein isoform X1 n=1 Tax=Anoplolepis gracilipes TaxID=354296 RepID=UPI003B9FD200
MLNDKMEIDIIEKYCYIARILTIAILGLCYFALIIYIILQYLPLIFDIVLPLNESRSCRLIFISEYFINQEKYIHVILLHHILAVSVAIIALCSTSSTLLTYCLHICALLNIASYRIENTMEWKMLMIPSPTRKYLLYRRIVYAVTLHRRAIKITKFFSSEFAVSFLILIVVGVTSLSLSLFQFLQFATLTNNITEILVYAFLICIHVAYMFDANYVRQIITDHGVKLFKATYNGMWYAAPLHTQKLLLFIMQKGSVNLGVELGGLFTASLEGFYMLLVFVTSQYNASLLFKILSTVFPILFVTVKYCLFIIQEDSSVKKMLEQMQNDWRLLKDKLEVNIMEKYANDLQFFSIILIVAGFCCILFLTILQLLPLILDTILPMNESRPFRVLMMTEHFVNPKKYIYIILLHELLACSIATTVLYGTLMTIATYMWHACALLKIASYRMENAIKKNALAMPIFEKQSLFHQKIVYAVLIHRRAVKFIKCISSNFALLFAILIIVGVSSLSINLFQLTTLINIITEDTCINIIIIILHISYVFIINYGGQKVTNHGTELFKAIYNGLWYATPLHTQKMLLFIMQKGTINIDIRIGRLFTISLEGFYKLINAAISYFIVIHSTGQ